MDVQGKWKDRLCPWTGNNTLWKLTQLPRRVVYGGNFMEGKESIQQVGGILDLKGGNGTIPSAWWNQRARNVVADLTGSPDGSPDRKSVSGIALAMLGREVLTL